MKTWILLVPALLIVSRIACADEPETAVQMPRVIVTGTNVEETLFGPNEQPEWTASRRFTRTHVYVLPPWQISTELGWRTTYPREGIPSHQLTQEIELGLPYRFQIDYQAAERIQGGVWSYADSSVELRWALADWDRIPLNPTLKAEYKFNNAEANAYELTLSLGGELASGWHWGNEWFYEQQVGDDREREYAVSAALSYTLIDQKLGIGIESKLSDETDKDDRHSHLQCFVGPSLQWRPTPRTRLDIAPLFGVTGPSPRLQTFIFFGFDFGPGSERPEALPTASLRQK
jgi:hypothetical protein